MKEKIKEKMKKKMKEKMKEKMTEKTKEKKTEINVGFIVYTKEGNHYNSLNKNVLPDEKFFKLFVKKHNTEDDKFSSMVKAFLDKSHEQPSFLS